MARILSSAQLIFTGTLIVLHVVGLCKGAPASSSDREEVTFYEEKDYGGDRLFVTLGSGCYNMDSDWDNKIGSVDTQGHCIIVWDYKDCKGMSIKLEPNAQESKDLSRVRFDKAISALSVCKDESARSKSRVSDKGGPEMWRVGVEEHNKYRRMHGVPDLKGDVHLHEAAQGHADYLAKNNKWEASTGNAYGENLATSYEKNKLDAIRDVVKRWYDKVEFYNFQDPESNKNRPKSGQFTSVIWKSTTHMGIGAAWNEADEKWIVVANYDPPARRTGYRENIPPTTTKSVHQDQPTLFVSAVGNFYDRGRGYYSFV